MKHGGKSLFPRNYNYYPRYILRRKLILLRHGQSEWNLENKFTGWIDVNLTKKGILEARKAGSLILEKNIDIDMAYCSYLKRAIDTCSICLKEMRFEKVKTNFEWRLNERHYGSLQGLNKSDTAKKYGEDQVLKWRRSYDYPPPKMRLNDDRHPANDKLYKNIDPKLLPSSESLKDTLRRVEPLLLGEILEKIKNDLNVLVVAHGNSLRAILKIIKKISDEEIIKLNIPTGAPYIIEFDENLSIINEEYLGDLSDIAKKTLEVQNQGRTAN